MRGDRFQSIKAIEDSMENCKHEPSSKAMFQTDETYTVCLHPL